MPHSRAVKRSELYELVWSQPMSSLAQKFGISNVGLAKVCRKHKIPFPPRGYWAKKQYGHEPFQIPLPRIDNDEVINIRSVSDQELAKYRQRKEVLDRLEVTKTAPLKIADNLRSCHPLVHDARVELEAAEVDRAKLIIPPTNPALSLRVSKVALRRSLLIMDSLIKALQTEGYEVSRGPSILIMTERLTFGITEQVETIRTPVNDIDLEGEYRFAWKRRDEKMLPTGRLTLKIQEGGVYRMRGSRHTWRDTKKRRLDDHLSSVLVGLIEGAARLREHVEGQRRAEEIRRQEELRREEAARQLAAKRVAFKAEQERVETLIEQSRCWQLSRLIRRFISARCRLHDPSVDTPSEEDLSKWVEWATNQADRFDPFRPSPPSILDERLPPEPANDRRYGNW